MRKRPKVPASQRSELGEIKDMLKLARPLTDKDARKVLDGYFKSIVWSTLKEEWDQHLTEEEKTALCAQLLREIEQ